MGTAPNDLQARRADPERVTTFVDAVFAIVITILVLEISVPSELSEQSLREALVEVWPTLIAWVISFLIVGMYWVWHRDLFIRMRAVNRDVVWLNLVFLLPVCLVPFAAAVLGEYHDEAIALHLYGVVLIAVSMARILLYWYVSRRPQLLWEPFEPRSLRLGLFLAGAPILLYLVAMLVAAFAPRLSLVIFLIVPGSYFVLITLLRDRPDTADDAGAYS